MILAHEMITYNIDKICVLQIQMCNPPTRFEENPVTFLLPGKYGKHAIGNKHELKIYYFYITYRYDSIKHTLLLKIWSENSRKDKTVANKL